ncbi:MAG: hypothetical protein ACR2NI_05955 [Pirellulales bacterium]
MQKIVPGIHPPTSTMDGPESEYASSGGFGMACHARKPISKPNNRLDQKIQIAVASKSVAESQRHLVAVSESTPARTQPAPKIV